MSIGRIILDYSSDVFFNLALEQAILQNIIQNDFQLTLRIWQNPPSAIIGRNQDVGKEIDIDYCEKNAITIARRISGGGTVYQDFGNLNVSIFAFKKLFSERLAKKPNIIEITESHTDILIKSLEHEGYNSLERFTSSNILYKGKKVSGSAGYHRGTAFLYHATLLYSANLNHLDSVCKPVKDGSKNKRRSHYYPTTNLPNFNPNRWKISIQKIIEEIYQINLEENYITLNEEEEALRLVDQIYSQKFWIYNGKRKQ